MGKLRLTQNIYVILNLVESEEMSKKKNAFPRESEKTSKGGVCGGNRMQAVIPLAYIMRGMRLQGT